MPEKSPTTTNGIPIKGAYQISAELSQELGEQVRVMDADWTRYASQGLVVDLHCHRERYRLQLSTDDLGIEGATNAESREIKRILAPGHVYLLPWDAVRRGDTLDSAARESLRRHAYKTFWGFWMHQKSYRYWREEIDVIKADYLRVVDQILENYERHRADAITGMIGLVNQSYTRLAQTVAARRIQGFADRESWVDQQVTRMVSRIPGPEEIRASYRMEWEVYRLPLLAEIEQDKAQAGQIRLDVAEERMLEDLRESAARRIQGGVDQFLGEVRGQIEANVCEAAAACLRAVDKNGGKLGRNNTVQLQKLVEANQSLVFWRDESHEARMQALQSILDTPANKREPEQVKSVLQRVGAESRLILMELGRPQPRSAADVGIPDELEDLVAATRRSTARTPASLITDLDDALPSTRTTPRQAIEGAGDI